MPELTEKNQMWTKYFAAASGAFLIGFIDLLQSGSNEDKLTIFRISSVLKQHFSQDLGQGWVALLFISIVGIILVPIYQPASRKDAFALGLSVFAILTSLTPYQQPQNPVLQQQNVVLQPENNLPNFAIFSSAYAAELQTVTVEEASNAREQVAAKSEGTEGESVSKEVELFSYFIVFENTSLNSNILLSLYDAEERNLFVQKSILGTDIAKFDMPKGKYVLLVESKGLKRVRVQLDFDKAVQGSVLKSSDSSVPLSLQRLFRPVVTKTIDLDDDETLHLIEKYNNVVKENLTATSSISSGSKDK